MVTCILVQTTVAGKQCALPTVDDGTSGTDASSASSNAGLGKVTHSHITSSGDWSSLSDVGDGEGHGAGCEPLSAGQAEGKVGRQAPARARDGDPAPQPPSPGPGWSTTVEGQGIDVIAGGNITNFWSFLASTAQLDFEAIRACYTAGPQWRGG
ncbi:MAG: hypothetical protein ACKPKO_50635, partial [Candidatus Fonsibacter sp.]